MESQHRIITGDSRRMTRVEDESVQLIVTSPPYWQLKDYGQDGQIGFHDTYESYVNNLNLVWLECARVLQPGGRVGINVGDLFARAAWYGRYKVIPVRTEIVRFLETVGLDYMGTIIWRKLTTCNTSGGASIMGSYPYPTNGVVKMDYESILLFKKPGKRPGGVSPERKEASRLSLEEWKEFFQGHWSFPGVRQDDHLAAFPLELPRRLIKMFSFVGDVVLDPFLGSGTTAVAAAGERRSSIGYEISREFAELARERVTEKTGLFARVECLEDPPAGEPDLAALPYLFRDPVRIDRPRGRPLETYGSKVDGTKAGRPVGVKVVGVPSHDTLELGDGRRVRLLGVGEPRGDAEAARLHLEDLCLGKKVVLSTDEGGAYAAGEGESVLVHLRNRTFINARLIKSGLVAPDRSREYRHRRRFERHAEDAAGA